MKFNDLIDVLSSINSRLQEHSLRAVNTSLTLRNWFFGFYILEFEQAGQDRAAYGKKLLAELSAALKKLSISNIDERELRRYRQFYAVYPSLGFALITDSPIRGTLPPESVGALDAMRSRSIQGMTSPDFEIPEKHFNNLVAGISYSHFIELIKITDPLQRLFYEIESLRNNWSVKELKRQIGSLLFERTGLSKRKEKLLESISQLPGLNSVTDIIKDPYVFEFIGLKAQEVFTERKLEEKLVSHLTDFLLELGKGFCYEARQKRIVIDNEHYFIDLVFYHRVLHCSVLIELKAERFHHSHAGQLNMYLEYFKKYEMSPGDNPPVGILLCTGKDEEHVEFATSGIDDKIFVSQYLVALPDKKVLEQFIRKELDNL